MRFLLQNSIMTARIPPDLLNAATVTALLIQTSMSETSQPKHSGMIKMLYMQTNKRLTKQYVERTTIVTHHK